MEANLKGGIFVSEGDLSEGALEERDRRYRPEIVVTEEGRNKKFKMRNLGATGEEDRLQRRVLKSQLMSEF